MKIGKRWPFIKDLLKQKGMLGKCFVAVNIGMKDQLVKEANKIKSDNLP